MGFELRISFYKITSITIIINVKNVVVRERLDVAVINVMQRSIGGLTGTRER